MKTECDVIRDLLPLYTDEICSDKSREMIEEHLRECPECSGMLDKLRANEIEEGLKEEKDEVIARQAKQFRRRSTTVGSVVSALFMVPILVCLIVNITTGHGLDWFYVVLAGLAVAASLIIVPMTVAEDKLFWTFCAFTMSVLFLLGVTCFYTHGNWFFTAASAVLFGLSVLFLPFVIRAKPVKALIGDFSKTITVVAVDVILFANMMNMISLWTKSIFKTAFILLLCAAGGWLLVNAISAKKGE